MNSFGSSLPAQSSSSLNLFFACKAVAIQYTFWYNFYIDKGKPTFFGNYFGVVIMCINAKGVCGSCGRHYDDLPAGSDCPDDDCPSNNYGCDPIVMGDSQGED